MRAEQWRRLRGRQRKHHSVKPFAVRNAACHHLPALGAFVQLVNSDGPVGVQPTDQVCTEVGQVGCRQVVPTLIFEGQASRGQLGRPLNQ